ncbi:MAG TPA: CoA transferase subunit A [Acidobacteriota bacterium]|nr:CoA transferase subunit A [Acidobacteriota bacterium]
MKSKLYTSCSEAVADIPDGATVMVGGFGHAADKPQNLIRALRDQGARQLTLIMNGAGVSGRLGIGSLGGAPFTDEEILIENRQVKKAVCSVPASLVMSKPCAFEKQYLAGEVDLEYVPQGTLAERIRAGGAGLGAFYTPTGAGTLVEQGKEKRVFDGREMLLEYALRADFALIRAFCADTMGNLIYRGVMRSFNAVMATAAKVTVVEVEHIVEAGELDPECIVTPGIFIDRIVAVPAEETR